MRTYLVRAVSCTAISFVAATGVHADPAPHSSMPWLLQSYGKVARSGSTAFFGDAYGIVPRVNQVRGLAVFPTTEGLSEPVDAADGLEAAVYSVIPDGSGGWYVAGAFLTFGGLPRRGLAHILPTGRVDPAFVADLNVGLVSGQGNALALNGSQLIVGGTFSTVNLVPRTGFAYLNATTGQVLPIVPPGDAFSLVLAGTTLFARGVGGQVQALNAATGTPIPGFSVMLTGGRVSTMAADDAFLYLAGNFSAVNGIDRRGLARVDRATGFVDAAWNPGFANGAVDSMTVAADALYIGGRFSTVGGQPRVNLAAVSTASGAATAWRADTDGTVLGTVVHGGALYVTGSFRTLGARPRLGAGAVGLSPSATVLPWNPSVLSLPRSIAAAAGRVAIGGELTGFGAIERQGLAAVNTATGELLPFAPNFEFGRIFDMIADGPRLIVGGGFTRVNGESRPGLAAFDLATYSLLPLAVTIDGLVVALATANGVLYIGGRFTTVNGAFRLNLAAIDLQTGQLLPWNPQADDDVVDLVAYDDRVVVAGEFTSLIGTNGFHLRTGVAEIAFGGEVTDFDAHIASGRVHTMARSGSSLLLGGAFAAVGGVPRRNLAAVQISSGALLPWNPDPDGPVFDISLNRGFAYLAGGFTTVGGAERRAIARVRESDGALTAWRPAFGVGQVYSLSAADDGLALSVSSPHIGDAFFLPEESLAGVPGPPAEPSVRIVGSTVSLAWEAPMMGTRPVSYLLQAGTAPGLTNIATLPLSATSFSTAGVPPGTYFARVRAVGTAGAGAASRELVFVVGAPGCTAPPTAPDPPTATVTGSEVVLNWQAMPGAAPGAYTLLAGSSAGFANVATLPLGPSTTFSTIGVPSGAYFVRVSAGNACGRSSPGADALVRVGGAPGPPSPPLHLSGSAAGGGVTLSWLTSTGGAPAAHVLEAGSGPTLSNIARVTLGPGASFATAGVPSGTYYLRVRALNAAGISPPSGELILLVP